MKPTPPDLTKASNSLQEMLNGFLKQLPYLVIGLVVFFVFFFLAKAVRSIVRRVADRNRKHYNLALVLGRIAQGTIIFIGLLIALVIAIPGFTPGQLISVLGLSSVAIGFAFRDIMQNFLAGILILLSEPFRIGDQIAINNFEGTVEEIQTRATFLKTYDGRRVVIPNANLFTNSVIVNTAFAMRRLEYDIGIGYGDDIARAKAIILDTLEQIDGVLNEPAPLVLTYDLAASTVDLRVRWWINPGRQADVLASRDTVLTELKNALTKAGIDLPFPTQQMLFHDQTEEHDGDRSRQREGWPKSAGAVPQSARLSRVLQNLPGAETPVSLEKPAALQSPSP